MMKKRQIFKQIVASLLLATLLLGLNGMQMVRAEEIDEDALYFEVNIEADNGNVYVSNFAIHENELYIRNDAVTKMADDISNMSYVTQSDTVDYAISRGETSVEYVEEETWGNYLPFAKTMTFLSLYPVYSEATNTMTITETMNLTELDKTLLEIYNEKSYNMAYWQASEERGGYKAHVKLAAIADCVKTGTM